MFMVMEVFGVFVRKAVARCARDQLCYCRMRSPGQCTSVTVFDQAFFKIVREQVSCQQGLGNSSVPTSG